LILWTSDTHFGHENILKYCKRPWSNVEEMNEGLIQRWNTVAKPEDEVYFHGDAAMGGISDDAIVSIFRRLNGKKYWIFGNHDSLRKRDLLLSNKCFEWGKDIAEISVNKQKMVLCHYPMLRWNGASHGSWMLHGHSHGGLSYPFEGKICDVSLDAWDWYPVTFEQIKAKIDGKPVVHETDRKTEAR
jgi:calcineurin-like phosphoesterase family protein